MRDLHVNISFESTYAPALSDDECKACIAAVLAHENVLRDCYVSLSFVENEQIRQLNKRWRKQDKPTDVLSFEMEHPDDDDLVQDEPCELGDIVLAPAYIADQAQAFASTQKDETRLLLIHATLHLLGYDHIQQDQAQKMEQVEDEIFASIPNDNSIQTAYLTRHRGDADDTGL